MKNLKIWIKEHKKEIMIGIGAAGCTALYFMTKDKKISCGVQLSIDLFNGKIDNIPDTLGKQSLYSNINLSNPDLSIKDLGKLGDLIKKTIPDVTNTTTIDFLSANYHKEI